MQKQTNSVYSKYVEELQYCYRFGNFKRAQHLFDIKFQMVAIHVHNPMMKYNLPLDHNFSGIWFQLLLAPLVHLFFLFQG